ncbi:MAG: LPS export ABC transporter periplasmic protein LptC [Wenzhouxiangella sp.]|nr:MAG: LPS export ABC transporter periplasmic protein LptC [Wenzhouxiangella sp.]
MRPQRRPGRCRCLDSRPRRPGHQRHRRLRRGARILRTAAGRARRAQGLAGQLPVTRRIVLTACLALVLVFLVRWQFPDDRSVRIAPTLPDTRFDYSLFDFRASFRAADGRVELLVSGPRLEHDSATRVATLFEPDFHIEPDGVNWSGRADRAELLREADEMVLAGNVVLEHPAPTGMVRITTERLHHHARERTIQSLSPVEMHQAGSFVQAGRMLIRLDDDTVEFSDHVQGELHPGRSDAGADRGHGQR